MSFKTGDIVKFVHNTEPCTVYRVLQDDEILEFNKAMNMTVKHTRIEGIGWVPTELITSANHARNEFALDRMLREHHKLS